MKPLWSALNLSLTKQAKPTMLISQIENVAQCDKKIVSCYNMSKKISAHISLKLRTSPHSFFLSQSIGAVLVQNKIDMQLKKRLLPIESLEGIKLSSCYHNVLYHRS